MLRTLRDTLFIAAAFSLFACDDGGGGGTKAVDDPATEMAGQTTGQQSAALTTIEPGGGADGAQGAISQVGAAMQGFANSHQQFKARQTAGSAPAGSAMLPLEALEQNQNAENTFSFEDGHLLAEVTYANAGTSIFYSLDLQIDAVDGGGYTMDGRFDMDFSTNTGMYEVDYDLSAKYDALKFDGAGCPIDGAIDLTYDISVSGAFIDGLPPEARQQLENGVAQSGRVLASFGPNCGDVAVEGT